ncbi:MAG: Spy/CpxP family protein refolding chaperone [Gammaproteobacteria bacterium]|jgi:protein CpxP
MRLINIMHKQCHRSRLTMGNWGVRRISKKLKLDERQQSKLSSLQNTFESGQSYIADIRKERSAMLDDIFTDSGFDRDSALHYLNIPRLAFEEQVPAIIEALGEFYQCLNPQQQEQLRELMRKHHQQRSRRCH